jgi:tRNA_anti-like
MITKKWLTIICSGVLLITYFLPWVYWDGSKVAGYAMATGDLFKIAEAKFALANPFPKLSFTFLTFWLIPVLAIVITFLSVNNKKTSLVPFLTTALSLSLITLYILFTDFGVGKNALGLMSVAAWAHVIAAIGLVFFSAGSLLKKLIWVVIGPVFVFASFKLIEKKLMAETHAATENVKSDYTIGAAELIKEFAINDTATNKKYSDKMLSVVGTTSAVEILQDSTSTIKFEDSTGSYAIFSLEKTQFDKVKTIKQGDAVSIKGVCSGSIYSEILGTSAITFKRATLNSTK